MAVMKRVKKGGEARWVLKGIQNGDFFTVPRGFKVQTSDLAVETTAPLAAAGNISLGKVVGVNGTYTMTITTSISTAGNITFSGGAIGVYYIAAQGVDAAPTRILTATAMAAAIAANPALPGVGNPGSWTATSSGNVVTMTCMAPGPITTAPSLSYAGTGGVGACTSGVTGTVDTTYLSDYPVPAITPSVITNIPLVNPIVNPATNGAYLSGTFTNTTGASGTYTVNGKAIALPTGLIANYTGMVMSGRTFYLSTLSWISSGNFTINGVTIASGANTTATTVNTLAAFIPGFVVYNVGATSGGVVAFLATTPGPTPVPTFALGGYLTNTPSVSIVGFSNPGYVSETLTPIALTITTNGVAGANSVASMNGTNIFVPNTATAAQAAAILAGCAWYKFTVATSATGTNYINGAVFTANATPATTATNIGALVNIPGAPVSSSSWGNISVSTDTIIMTALTPGIAVKPTFQAGAVAAPTLSGEAFTQGFTLPGYTQTYTATTAVWTGPSPLWQVVVAPTTQTWIRTGANSGSTGSFATWTDQTDIVGAPTPSLTGSITTQTYTTTTYPADINIFVNLSRSEMYGKTNLYVNMMKVS